MKEFSGFAPLYRKVGWDEEWLFDHLMFTLFFGYILTRMDRHTGTVKLSLSNAAGWLGVSRGRITRALERLQSRGTIKLLEKGVRGQLPGQPKGHNKPSVYRVCNWDKYNPRATNDTSTDTTTDTFNGTFNGDENKRASLEKGKGKERIVVLTDDQQAVWEWLQGHGSNVKVENMVRWFERYGQWEQVCILSELAAMATWRDEKGKGPPGLAFIANWFQKSIKAGRVRPGGNGPDPYPTEEPSGEQVAKWQKAVDDFDGQELIHLRYIMSDMPPRWQEILQAILEE